MGFAAIVTLISYTRQLRNREIKCLARLFRDYDYVDAARHSLMSPKCVCEFILFFGHAVPSSNQELNLWPLQWKLTVLTTGPLKKSPPKYIFSGGKGLLTSHGVSLWTHLLPLVRRCFHLPLLLSFPLSAFSSSALPSLWDTHQSSECIFSAFCSITSVNIFTPKKVTFWVTECRRCPMFIWLWGVIQFKPEQYISEEVIQTHRTILYVKFRNNLNFLVFQMITLFQRIWHFEILKD